MVFKEAINVVRAARGGDRNLALSHLIDLKVICGTRRGHLGVAGWTVDTDARLATLYPDILSANRWYVGKPVIVTANDYANRTFNGDVGVVVEEASQLVVAIPGGDDIRTVGTAQLGHVEPWWAMTVHKSQGSEFRRVVVALPPPGSPMLTRELLYTAVTRSREQLTVVASRDAIRMAIERTATRASGLGGLLRR